MNELSLLPQKTKYQLDEIKIQFQKEIEQVRSKNESKIKEMESYIQNLH